LNSIENKLTSEQYFDDKFNEKIIIDVEKEINELKQTSTQHFEETKFRKGWELKILKINELMINLTLYDNSGKFVESKMFNIRNDNDIENMRKYIQYFEDDPEKNLKKMEKLEAEEPIHQPDFDMINRYYKHNY
jgi:hypothetical protein